MSTSVHSHSQFGPIDTSMTAESSTSGSRSRTPQIDQAPRQTESDAEWSSSEDDEEGIFFGQHDPAEEQLLDQLTASQGASPAIIKPAMLSLDIAHSQSSDRTRVKKRDSRDFLRRKTLLLSTQHNPASPRMSPRMSTLQKSSRTSRRVSMTKQPLRELVLDDSESSEEDGTPARSRWLEIPAGSPAFVEEDNTDPSDLTFTFSTFHLSTPPAAPAPAGVTSSLSLPRTSDDSEEEDEDEEGDSDKENIAIPINNASPNSIIPSEPVRRRTETIMIGMDIQEEEEGEHHVLAELNMGGLNIGDFDDPDMDVRGSSESPHVDIIDLGSASSDDGEDSESPSSDLLKSPSIARTTLGSTSLLALTPGSQRSRTPPSTTPAEGDGVTAGLSGTPSNQSELSDSPLPVNRGGPIIIPQISHLTFSMRAESGSPYRDLQMPHFTPPAEPGDHGERGLSGLHMDFMASPSEKQSLQPLLMSTPPPQTEFVQRTDEVPPQSKAPKLSSSLLGVSTRTKALSPRSAKKEKRMIDRKQAIRGQLDQAVAGRTNNMGPPRRAVLSTTAVRPASALGLHSIPDRPPSRSESISSVPPPQKSLTSTTSILKPTRSALPKPKPLGTSIGGPKSLSEPTRIPTKPPVRTLPSYTPLTSSTRAPLVQRTLPPAKATLASKSGKLEPAVRQPPVIAPLQTSVIGTNGAARQMVPVVRTGVNPLKRPITQVHENLGRSAVAAGGISRGPLGMSERSAPETSSSLLLAPGPVFSIGSYEPEPLSIAQNTRASRSPGRFGPPARPAATPSFSRTAKTFGTPSRLTGTPGRKRILGTPSRAPPVIYAPTTSEPTKPTTSSASIVPPTDHSLRSHEQREATTRQMSSPVRGSSADHDEVSIMIAQTDSSQQGSSPPAKITRRTPLLDRLAAEEKAEQEEKARQEEKERTEQEKRQEQRRMLAEKARAQAQRELADEELETSRQPSPPILRSNKSPTPSPSKVRSETKATSPDHPPSTHKAARPKRAIKAPVPAASATKPSMRVGIMGPSIVPNMSEKELRETTKRNTAKNEVYHCAIDRQIIRKTGPRPPSPTSKIRTTADKEEEEKKQGRGERAKRRSGSAAPTADEGSEGEEQEYPTIQRIAWKNVAGEEIGEYVAPPESTRPNKKLKLNSLDTSTASTPSKSRNRTRRVKWDNGLILIRNDGSDLKSLSRTPSCEISQLPPGALRNTTSVELDSNGNVIDGKRPAQQLKRHKVVVTAIFYEGEEPAPFDYAKPPSSTKGKKK